MTSFGELSIQIAGMSSTSSGGLPPQRHKPRLEKYRRYPIQLARPAQEEKITFMRGYGQVVRFEGYNAGDVRLP